MAMNKKAVMNFTGFCARLPQLPQQPVCMDFVRVAYVSALA